MQETGTDVDGGIQCKIKNNLWVASMIDYLGVYTEA